MNAICHGRKASNEMSFHAEPGFEGLCLQKIDPDLISGPT
jgi:hypothetical protein